MPMYPYKCSKCGHEFEVRRKFSDEGNEYCPECDALLTKEDRTITAAAFSLTGNGWYKDGYANKESSKYAYQD